MADRQINELDPVKEVPIGDLPQVLDIYDDSLIPLEQQGMAMRMTGRQFRQFGEKTAEIYVQTAVDAATDAEAAKTGAESARDAAAQSAANAAASETAAGRSRDAAAASATAAKTSEENAKASEADVAANAAAAKASEEKAMTSEDAAKASQDAAKASETRAQSSASKATEEADRAQDIADGMQTDWDAIHKAVEDAQASAEASDASALRSEAAADDANFDADRAEEAANRAQSIAQGAKGYYETPETLRKQFPSGTSGDWAIVGSTDTIWVWDSDTGEWSDSGNKTDLSNYYTKDQADAENNELLAQVTQETDEKLDGKVSKSGDTMSGKLTNASGFVGPLEGNASTATKLATPRSLKTKLDSTAAVTFDGSAAQDAIPVTGTLPVANGGTGRTSIANITANLASTTAANPLGGNIGVSGILGTANGGTGNNTGKAPTAGTADTAKACTGNANTATKLSPGANINGVKFDGSGNITVADSTKVAKTGDTMTGNLTLSGETQKINFKTSTRTGTPFTMYAGSANGSGLVIGDGGRTIIGGGEAAPNLHGALTSTEDAEEMHIAGDGAVFVHTACQTVANRKTFTFNANGTLTLPGYIVLGSGSYGTALPAAGTKGRVFFLKA